MSADNIERYIRREMRNVQGWLGTTDARIAAVLCERQQALGLTGGVAEIGVHHGKFLLLLALGLADGERAWCVDLFDAQDLNRDRSGRGDRAMFEANLARHGIDPARIVVRQGSSGDCRPEDVIDAVGPARFFSVDGGHWADIVVNDLALADGASAPHGIVALDDFMRSEWPDVSAGYFRWRAETQSDLVPLCIGFNKLYLCRPTFAKTYGQALDADPILRTVRAKTYRVEGRPIPVLDAKLLPEMSLGTQLDLYLRWVAPHRVASWRRLKRLSRPRGLLAALKRRARLTRRADP